MYSNLQGQFHSDKANLLKIGETLHLVIGTRKKATPQKPPHYLLQRVSPKQHIYISSLFEWQEMSENGLKAYSFDYKGVDYVLIIDTKTQIAQISLLNQQPVKGVVSNK